MLSCEIFVAISNIFCYWGKKNHKLQNTLMFSNRFFFFFPFSYVQRVRFSTSVLFSLSIGVELLTPAFPQQFLLLATLANVAKQISLASYLATSVRFLPLQTAVPLSIKQVVLVFKVL